MASSTFKATEALPRIVESTTDTMTEANTSREIIMMRFSWLSRIF